MEFKLSKDTLNEIKNKYDSKIINGIVVPTWEGVIRWFLEHGGSDVGIPPDFRTIGINSNTKLEVIGYDSFAWLNKEQQWTKRQTFNGYVQTYYDGVHTNYGAKTITKNIDGGESYVYTFPNATGTLALTSDVEAVARALSDEAITRQQTDTILDNKKQDKQDNNLQTTDKTIVGAINEINAKPIPAIKILQKFTLSLHASFLEIDETTYRVKQIGTSYIHTFRFSMNPLSSTIAEGKFVVLLDTDTHVTDGDELLVLNNNILSAFATIYVANHQMWMLAEFLKSTSGTNGFDFVGTILE